MAKLTIRITHVAWRDGRPRFQPGPKLRALGFKGQDLRHGPEVRGVPTGPWYTAEEALAWSTEQERRIAARKAEVAKARTAKRKAPAAPAARPIAVGLTVGDLFATWFRDNPLLQAGKDVVDGKRRQKARAASTIEFYRQKARVLEQFDAELWTAPVDALSGRILYDLYERLWTARGLATARSVIATLSSAISWGMRRGRVKLGSNPAKGLGMETAAPRLRCLTPTEIRRLVAAADAIGRPEIGDAIVLGVWTGQRQADRLAMIDIGAVDGRRVLRQQKTGAVVMIPEAPELAARLATLRMRRAAWKVTPTELIADSRSQRPFTSRSVYAHVFQEVRDAAVAGIKEAATGREIVPATPSLADARDQDLRDTAVTWLARAGCTLPEICAITGHELQSATQVMRHYLGHHAEIADAAIRKLVAWYDAEGASAGT